MYDDIFNLLRIQPCDASLGFRNLAFDLVHPGSVLLAKDLHDGLFRKLKLPDFLGQLRDLGFQFFAPVPDKQQTVIERDNVLPYGFHRGGDGGDGGFHGLFQLHDSGFHGADHSIVGAYLAVCLATLGNKTGLLHLSGADALMDGGMLVKAALGVAAVVNALGTARPFQSKIDRIGPRRPFRPTCQQDYQKSKIA